MNLSLSYLLIAQRLDNQRAANVWSAFRYDVGIGSSPTIDRRSCPMSSVQCQRRYQSLTAVQLPRYCASHWFVRGIYGADWTIVSNPPESRKVGRQFPRTPWARWKLSYYIYLSIFNQTQSYYLSSKQY